MEKVLAGGPFGTDNGWAVDNTGTVLLTSGLASQMSAGETGWIRIEMRLFGSHTNWDSVILSDYDAAVNNARNVGLQVLLLVDGGSWPGGQPAWCANNSENNPGSNGDNAYVEEYATNAVVPIVLHFRDRVQFYELWNEPNCWSSNPSNGVFTGCTFIYPSNYGWLLARSWGAVHMSQAIADVTLFFGGVFGHNIGGATSYANAGAQYIDDTYSTGTNVLKGEAFHFAKTNYNAYPLDGIGEHIYLNPGSTVASNTFRQYEDWVRQACTKYEGAGTTKKTFITEFGWQTTNVSNANGVSQAIQETNLNLAFGAIRATPYVQMAIWFQWKDNPAGSLWYGVLDSSGNPKQSFADYQQFQRFEGRYPAGTTNSSIQSYYYGLGQSVLGNPFDHGHGPSVYALLDGYAQDFDGGSHLGLTVVTSTNGTFEINDLHGFWTFYNTNNGPSRYGFPTGNPFGSTQTRQNFTYGSLAWDSVTGVRWTFAPPILFQAGQQVLTWTGFYTLQWATNFSGPFFDVSGATSPYTNGLTYGREFFRLRH
jgi:hypothetical protein